MYTERQVRETIALCLDIMGRYYNAGQNPRSYTMMVAETQVMAGGVMELGLRFEEIDAQILRPVGSKLLDRFGHELGSRLCAEFLKAFDDLSITPSGMLEQSFVTHRGRGLRNS